MRKLLLIHLGYICALCVSVQSATAAPPTMGGKAAFATKADAMATTVEGFIQAKKYVAAEKAALELTRQDSEHLKGWLLLAYCRTRTAKYAESNSAYDRALELGADAKSARTSQAYNYIMMRDFESARSAYRDVLDDNNDDPEILKKLGYLEGKLGNYDEAARYYGRVLERDPDDGDVIRKLVKIEKKRGGNDAVLELLKKSLVIDPDHTESLSQLGLIYIHEKNFKAAIEPLQKLLVLEPGNSKAHRNLGVAYYQLGEKSRARVEFQAVRGLNGDLSGLYGPLADCYVSSGAGGEALDVVQEGLEKGDQEAWLYCMWGKVLEKSGSYDQAIEKFRNAVRLKEEPWSGYARKQIARQSQLKQRAQMMQSQGMK